MPIEYADNIPAMFGRVYTAPPPEIFFDMYENAASFDEAAKNLYDKEMESDYDTDLPDEFFTEGIGAMGGVYDIDDSAVEKAIYQTNIAQEQGIDPSGITTPYGLGLTQDEIDQVIDEYPGINAGVDWRTMDDHYHDAEEILNDPRAGTAISNLVDVAVGKAEDEGAIDSIGDIFKAFGEQLGRAGQSAAEAHVASRTELDADTGDLFLGPSVGPNPSHEMTAAIADTTNEIVKVFENGEGNPPPTGDTPPDADPVDQLMEIFEKMLVGQTSNEGILWDVHQAFSATTDHRLFAGALARWITSGGWNDRVENAGAKPSELFNEIAYVFKEGYGTSYEGINTSQWGDRTVRLRPAKTDAVYPEALRQNRIDVLREEYEDRGTPISEAQAGYIVDAIDLEVKDEPTLIEYFLDGGHTQEEAARLAKIQLGETAVDPYDMRERHTRALSKAFYETIYAQPWGSRAEFASILPAMLSETKTLFIMDEALPGIDGLTDGIGPSPELGAVGAESPVGDKYKIFLNKYLQNASTYRTGPWLAKHVGRINELLKKRTEEPGAWTDKEDLDDWLWIEPMFWDTSLEARVNQYNLITMVAAQGRQGYMANMIKAGTARAIEHYGNMGYAGGEIFALMTGVFGRTGGRASIDTWGKPEMIGLDSGYENTQANILSKVNKEINEAWARKQAELDTQAEPYGTTELNTQAELDAQAALDTQAELNAQSALYGTTELDTQTALNAQTPLDGEASTLWEEINQQNKEARERLQKDVETIFARGLPPTMSQPGRMGGVSATLTDDDIADMLAEFDMGVEMSTPPSRRMGPSRAEMDAMYISDFGM